MPYVNVIMNACTSADPGTLLRYFAGRLLACQCWARLRTRQLSRALQDWHVRARRSGHLERLRQLLQRSLRHRHMAAALEAWSR